MTTKEARDYFEKLMNDLQKKIDEIDANPSKLKPFSMDENYQKEDYQEEGHQEGNSTDNKQKENHHKHKSQKYTKKDHLDELKEKYPHPTGKWGYNDRDERQYSKLVSTKELNVAEFVLKWEFVHQHRIHKNMAWELLTERKENGSISDEFLKQIEENL